MTLQRLLAQLALPLVLAGCAAGTPIESTSIDAQYQTGGGVWNSGGGITFAFTVFERNGGAAVCGAWTMDRQSVVTSELNRPVVEVASVVIGGDRLIQNLWFMRQVPYSDNITGQQANCVLSDRPWKAAYDGLSPEVRIPRLTIVQDFDPGSVSKVTFRQSHRPDIVR